MNSIMRLVITVLTAVAVTVFSVLFLLQISRGKQLAAIKPLRTYGTLEYLAAGCEAYNRELGEWPGTMDQLRAFRPDLNRESKDAFGQEAILVPYNEQRGYG